MVALFAPALLAALVVVETLSEAGVLILLDARDRRRGRGGRGARSARPVLAAIALAALTTARLRTLG